MTVGLANGQLTKSFLDQQTNTVKKCRQFVEGIVDEVDKTVVDLTTMGGPQPPSWKLCLVQHVRVMKNALSVTILIPKI